MNTSTPLRKIKSCSNVTNLNNINNFAVNNLNLNEERDFQVCQSEIIFTKNSENPIESTNLFECSPITCRRKIPRSLLPLLDSPLEFSLSILTPHNTDPQKLSPDYVSDDSFIRTVHYNTEKKQACTTNVSKLSLTSFQSTKETELFENLIGHDINSENYINKSNRSPSPVIASQKKEKKSRCKVNKNLFSIEKSLLEDCGEHSSTGTSFNDITLNALEKLCQNNEILNSAKSSSIELNINKLNHTEGDEFDFSFNNSFDVSKNEIIEMELDETRTRHFVYPYDNLEKPPHRLLVDDIIKSVLPLERNDRIISIEPPSRSQNFRTGLVSFNELNSLLINEIEYEDVTQNKQKMSAFLWSSNLQNEIIISKKKILFYFRDIFKNKDLYHCLKRYFEYYRINFVRQLFQVNSSNLYKEIVSIFDSTELYHSFLFIDANINNCFREKIIKLNASSTTVYEFFNFFKTTFNLMYNFNISRHGCYNFSIIRFNQIRNEHRKRKRRVDHLKIIKNVSSSDKISQQFSTVRAILNQRENNITTNNVSTNSNGLQQISELCDETEEDMKIIEYQLTSLCESLEKSSRFNSTFDEQKNNSFCSIMKINDISDLNENNEDVRSVVESQKLEMRDVFIETAYIFPNYESEQLPTFKTASGKQVNFNNKSLLMAKKLFDSVTENVETNKHFSVLEESLENNAENSVKNLNLDDLEIAGTSKAESHFQTNGRKPRNVTNKLNAPDFKQIDFKFDMCSSKANSTCSNYSTSKPNYNENLIIKENNLLNNGEDDINRQFVSFGGVSEKSLNTAEKLLGYVEEDLTENIPNWDETVHFNTSNELFNFDENILNEFSNDGYLDKQEKLKEYEKDRKGIHESTPVDVNKDSFTRKKKSLEDNIILENTNNKLKTIDIVNTDIKNLPGFSTACGKQLIVNEKSLLKVKKLFENISCEIEKEIPEFLHTDSLKHLIDQKVTTNVKRRNIAEKSSIVANKLFDCEEMEKADDPQKAKIKTSASQTLEFFSTASGKQIDVREQSLQTAQKLFDSIFKDTEEDVNVFDNESTKKENCIFSTVKRRRMEVNEDLLLKNKLPKIKEMYNAEDINTQNIIENKFIPFNINDTKRIHIDEQLPFATEKLNETQQNIDQRFNMKGIINSQLAAFHTANGKQINITEKSLQLAKKLFEDVDKDRETIKSQENLTSSLKNDQPMNDVDQNNKCTQFHTKKFIAKSKELLSNFFKNNAEKNTEEQFREIKMRSDVAINVRPLIEFKGSSDDVRKTIDVREKLIDFTKNKLNDEFKDQKVENYCTNFNEDFEHEIAQTCKQVLEYKSIESAVLTDAKVMDFHLQDAEKKNPVYDVVETSLTSNVSREVTESTSAFLFDMNCDTSFIPVDDVSFNSFNLPEKKEMEMEKQHSKPSSPVFESNKISRRKKNKKRRSQCSLSLTPLNVTYMRKENDDVLDSRTSSEDIFKMFKDNFAQKSVKRKESVSDMVYPLSKKAKKSDYKVELSDKRKQAAIDQQTYINTKDRESCKPNCGRYLSEKLNGKRNTLRETVNNERPQRYQTDKLLQLGLKRSVIAVSSENAEDFVFTSDFLNSAHVNCVYDTYGDDCKVIPNENNEVHFENLARAFLASPGVDPVLITLPWIRNHYRWIIWKLASTEKSFPHIFGAKYLTLDNALFQLKFRYDFEIDRCQRSALKCILEFDDSASKPIILCIATLKESTTSLGEYEMELTDGWYNIRCQIDSEMNKLICKKKVTIGTKLLIMNAELIGANEGCDPLQIKDNVRLKIASNSVRRVRWDTRLGFYFGRTMILQDIRAVLSNGGMISQVLTVIVRVYPLLYLEKKDNCSVLYNEKTYLKKTTDYEKKRQVYLENLVSQVTAEVRKENYLSDSDEYRNFSQSEIDPEILQAERFGEQEKLRILIEERVRNKLPEEFKELRPTSRLLKIRLINNEDSVLPLSALLTIWHPSEDLISLLYEGKLYSLQNIIANGYRNGELQLSTSRMTKYESLSIAPKTTKYRRCVTKFDELKNDFTSVFGEIDTVGIVFGVEDSTSENDKYRNQTVYLADLEQNILAVVFRSSIKNFGYEDTFKRKGIIGCLNLQWKRGFLYWKIPVVFVSEFTSFVHKSHHKHLQKYLDKFDTHFKNQCIDSFLMECDKKLKTIISLRPVATSTPLKICSKTTSAENTDTVAVKTSTSVFKHKSSECSFDSHNSSRNTGSKSVQSRIEKLRGYGEPPSLSPISLSTCRKRVGRLSVQTRVFKSSCDKT